MALQVTVGEVSAFEGCIQMHRGKGGSPWRPQKAHASEIAYKTKRLFCVSYIKRIE
jgi:hypothetical protein